MKKKANENPPGEGSSFHIDMYKPNSVLVPEGTKDNHVSRNSVTDILEQLSPRRARGTALHARKDLAVSPFDFTQGKP